MSTTEFTPERSAAIRQLLIDTVEDEPRRRKRLQVLLTSVLSGVAVALAGGTAALALTGVLHFGGGDTAPAPAPTPTPTVTPTPTPTPTATPTSAPLVVSGTVLPHDVDSLGPHTPWSLDLPGSDCTGARSFTLSDSRAVYLSGVRPKEYEGAGEADDCAVRPDEHLGLTLVDTSSGKVLWTREWRFTPQQPTYQVGFTVLGTSGRALLFYPNAGSGPHEVIDLSTGEPVASFEPDWNGFQPYFDVQPVPGPSGDVLLLKRDQDAEGRSLSTDTIMRVAPTDLDHPLWTASLPSMHTVLDVPPGDAGGVVAEGWSATDHRETTMVLFDTGAKVTLPPVSVISMSRVLIGRPDASQSGDGDLTGYALDGSLAWTKRVPNNSQVFRAASPGDQTIGTPDTGEFFVADRNTITLYDQATGDELWSVPTSSCVAGTYGVESAMLDAANDAFVLAVGPERCELSHSAGTLIARSDRMPSRVYLFGLTNRYSFGYTEDASPGTAYSLSTGDQLWTHDQSGWWSFDGGYLVSRLGNRIESIG